MKSNKELFERALRSGFQDKDYQLSLLTMANTTHCMIEGFKILPY